MIKWVLYKIFDNRKKKIYFMNFVYYEIKHEMHKYDEKYQWCRII